MVLWNNTGSAGSPRLRAGPRDIPEEFWWGSRKQSPWTRPVTHCNENLLVRLRGHTKAPSATGRKWRGVGKTGKKKQRIFINLFIFVLFWFVCLLAYFILFSFVGGAAQERGEYGRTRRWVKWGCMMWNSQRINKEVKCWKSSCYLETCLVLENYYIYIKIMLFSPFHTNWNIDDFKKDFHYFLVLYSMYMCLYGHMNAVGATSSEFPGSEVIGS